MQLLRLTFGGSAGSPDSQENQPPPLPLLLLPASGTLLGLLLLLLVRGSMPAGSGGRPGPAAPGGMAIGSMPGTGMGMLGAGGAAIFCREMPTPSMAACTPAAT
jgi:hypothetical protein